MAYRNIVVPHSADQKNIVRGLLQKGRKVISLTVAGILLTFELNAQAENNGLTFVRNLPPSLGVGETRDTIIDANGGGGVTFIQGYYTDGNPNTVLERREFIGGTRVKTDDTNNQPGGGAVYRDPGTKMVARGVDPDGDDECGPISGSDEYFGYDEDSNTPSVNRMLCATEGGTTPLTWLGTSTELLPEGEGIRLNFSVQEQVNNDHFDILWSTDGDNRKKIGEIAGAGNALEKIDYTFDHDGRADDPNKPEPKPRKGTNYYLVRQVDGSSKSFDNNHPNNPDNASQYSKIVQQHFDGFPLEPGELKIYPNTVRQYEWFTVEGINDGDDVVLYNKNSQPISFERDGDQMRIPNVPGDMYIVKNRTTGATNKVLLLGGSH